MSLGIGACFLLAGGLCKFHANAGGKLSIQRQPLFVQHKQLKLTLTAIKKKLH
jgi:hypothetical protein